MAFLVHKNLGSRNRQDISSKELLEWHETQVGVVNTVIAVW